MWIRCILDIFVTFMFGAVCVLFFRLNEFTLMVRTMFCVKMPCLALSGIGADRAPMFEVVGCSVFVFVVFGDFFMTRHS